MQVRAPRFIDIGQGVTGATDVFGGAALLQLPWRKTVEFNAGGNSPQFILLGRNELTLQVEGASTLTLVVEGSLDTDEKTANWRAINADITADGFVTITANVYMVRFRITAGSATFVAFAAVKK